jgi:hypothetical protein
LADSAVLLEKPKEAGAAGQPAMTDAQPRIDGDGLPRPESYGQTRIFFGRT